MANAELNGRLRIPANCRRLEFHRTLMFVTRVKYQLQDETSYLWNPRRHRKHFRPLRLRADGRKEERSHRASFLVWKPSSLNWWIAVLFMIGSFGFVLGSFLFLVGYGNYTGINLIFFVSAFFFTSASYCQYYQAINAGADVERKENSGRSLAFAWQPWNISFWATAPQFVGTLLFNVNTLAAFLRLGTLGEDLLVWVPDMVGSILFQISGTLALLEICHRWWCVHDRDYSWWVTVTGFFGCVAFIISAILAFQRVHPVYPHMAAWATLFTLIGAALFFVSAYLMWPEMTSEEGDPQ